MKRSLLSSILALLAAPAALLAQNTVVVTANVTANTTWTRTNTYLLDTKIYVTNGATLTIEPGTVIKGRPKANPVDATALVIARGAKINAQGTATTPIIFTAESDLLNGNLTQSERGLWGGVAGDRGEHGLASRTGAEALGGGGGHLHIDLVKDGDEGLGEARVVAFRQHGERTLLEGASFLLSPQRPLAGLHRAIGVVGGPADVDLVLQDLQQGLGGQGGELTRQLGRAVSALQVLRGIEALQAQRRGGGSGGADENDGGEETTEHHGVVHRVGSHVHSTVHHGVL